MKRIQALPMLRAGLSVLVVAAWTACGGDGTGDVVQDLCTGPACPSDVLDVAEATPDEGTQVEEVREVPAEVAQDTGKPETVDECNPDCDATPGAFGCACLENRDCDSNFCVLFSDQTRRCTVTCVENCCDDWKCSQVIMSGGDPTWLCVPDIDPLCNMKCLQDGV